MSPTLLIYCEHVNPDTWGVLERCMWWNVGSLIGRQTSFNSLMQSFDLPTLLWHNDARGQASETVTNNDYVLIVAFSCIKLSPLLTGCRPTTKSSLMVNNNQIATFCSSCPLCSPGSHGLIYSGSVYAFSRRCVYFERTLEKVRKLLLGRLKVKSCKGLLSRASRILTQITVPSRHFRCSTSRHSWEVALTRR